MWVVVGRAGSIRVRNIVSMTRPIHTPCTLHVIHSTPLVDSFSREPRVDESERRDGGLRAVRFFVI